MSFLQRVFGRRKTGTEAVPESRAPNFDTGFHANDLETLQKAAASSVPPAPEMDQATADLVARATAAEPAEPAAPGPSRARRNRTRLIGFDHSAASADDGATDAAPAKPAAKTLFPAGWVLVVEGPGRGHCFAISNGMAQIGRGEDQAIQLDFGDTAISRSHHAAIAYDETANTFHLGHGGKTNIVRLNGKPVIASEQIRDNDKITIGETTLQLKTLCDDSFNWSSTEPGEEQEHVAIA